MNTRNSTMYAIVAVMAAFGLTLGAGIVSAQDQVTGQQNRQASSFQTAQSVCTLTQPEVQFEGSQQLYFGNFAFILPDGRFIVAMLSEGGASRVEICYVADGSTLVIDPATGSQLSRDAKSAEAATAFDRVISTARTTGRCLADCGPGVTPPKAGDAGLASR